MKSQQTDSSHLPEKIAIRIESLSGIREDVKVLELFAGQSVVWKRIIDKSKWDITTTRIDKKKIADTIKADNLKIIPGLNLSRYNVIDCDSYGDAFEQIKALFENGSLHGGTVVHYTFMRVGFGVARTSLLSEIGISKAMIRICPSLFGNLSYQAFLAFLFRHGIRTIWETIIQENRRVYGYFVVAKKPVT